MRSVRSALALTVCGCAVAVAIGLGTAAPSVGARPDKPDFLKPDIPEIVGTAVVVDGDTIIVGDHRVRLEGIDAPELDQFCMRASSGEAGSTARVARSPDVSPGALSEASLPTSLSASRNALQKGEPSSRRVSPHSSGVRSSRPTVFAGKRSGTLPGTRPHSANGEESWAAGQAARRALRDLIANQLVSCTVTGYGAYGRPLGKCFAGGRNLNKALVRQGFAWAFVRYSQSYVADERVSRSQRHGLWSAKCQTAWDFRAGRWAKAAHPGPAGCPIKGNVSRNGRIYHMPWDRWYNRTRISPARGERWFCSEREALDAGWRPAS